MIITSNERYLILPCNEECEKQSVKIISDGKLRLNLDVRLDFNNPQYHMHYDLKNFIGFDIDILCKEKNTFDFCAKKNVQEESFRPKIHFSAHEGWINDPNGLVYYEGNYHMFFQHNPCGKDWGNMHWGHAVSKDLINWTELDETLFPDEHGAMFSGSAVIDKDNLLNLKTGEHDTIVLFYTAAGDLNVIGEPKKYTQCMAYSTDGAKTFVKYENNPIIEHITAQNRDPKIVYDEDSKLYIMALYLDADEFAFFKSANLKDWEKICTYSFENENECPDFYPLKDGDKTKWVLTGAHDYYSIGDFDADKGFYNTTEPKKFGYGRCYAAQSFYGLEGRRLRISWNRFFKAKTNAFTGAMSIPCDISLENGNLCITAADEIKKAYSKSREFDNVSANDFNADLGKNPVDITINFKNIKSDIKIKIFGCEICLGSDVVLLTESDGKKETMPAQYNDKKTSIRIICDSIGTEIFFKHLFGAFDTLNNYDENYISICGNGDIEKITINEF